MTDVQELATWRISLWLDNDEGLYLASREIVRNAPTRGPQAGIELKQLIKEAHSANPELLSDAGTATQRAADWTEIANEIREESDDSI